MNMMITCWNTTTKLYRRTLRTFGEMTAVNNPVFQNYLLGTDELQRFHLMGNIKDIQHQFDNKFGSYYH